jgi:hypothetical protein
MPSGDDAVPWLGDYPFGGAGGNQGVHMIGLAANRPAASLGTRVGSDGAVSGGSTAFSATSGRFVSANTGDTIRIVDTGASPAVVYSFTVTYVSATALTLSSAWAGTGTSNLSWSLLGQGPSNAGLRYFATDTPAEYESTGTDWLELPQGGGSSLIFWPAADQADASYDNSTWADNIEGSGFYEALKFPATAVTYGAFAMGVAGEAFPRMIIGSSMGPDASVLGGIGMGEGTIDPAGKNGVWYGILETKGTGTASLEIGSGGQPLLTGGIDTNSGFGNLAVLNGLQLSRCQGGGARNITQYGGHGVPTIGGNVGDLYWRDDGGAGTYLYRCTVAGGGGAATWVGIL